MKKIIEFFFAKSEYNARHAPAPGRLMIFDPSTSWKRFFYIGDHSLSKAFA